MIIVSQDKKELINFQNVIDVVITNEDELGYSISAGVIKKDDNYRTLGYYKTEERATKVLEELINKYLKYATISNVVGDVKEIYTIPRAYIMPEE